MKSALKMVCLLAVLSFGWVSAEVGAEQPLTFKISGFKNFKGNLMIGVYTNQKTFLKPKKIHTNFVFSLEAYLQEAEEQKLSEKEIKKQAVEFSVLLKAGVYAFALLHDQNSNEKLDRFLFVPLETIGFSRHNGSGPLPPSFKKSAVDTSTNRVLEIRLKNF